MRAVMLLSLALASAVSPVGKVLQLLDSLEKKVVLDGEVEQKQFEKFSEFCEDEAVKKQYEIKDNKARVEDLSATIEKETGKISNAASTIEELAGTISTNQKDLDAAAAIRKNEREDFDKADQDLEETIDMLGRATGIISRNIKGGAFAQMSKDAVSELTMSLGAVLQARTLETNDASKIQALLQDADDDDFLSRSAPDAAAYESKSGGILDTLEDMKDKAVSMRNDAQKAEMNAQHAFNMLKQSLDNALKADNKDFKATKMQKAASSEAKGMAESDLSAQQRSLAENEESLQVLGSDCQTKASDAEESKKSRADELKALQEAIKVLKGTTGGAADRTYGFLQATLKTPAPDTKVVSSLQQLGRTQGDMALSQLALRVQAAFQMSASADVFGKVRSMIEELIAKLVAEAGEETDHKAWCDKETSETREKIDDHQSDVEKLSAKIDKAEAAIVQLGESSATLQASLADLAKMRVSMDEMRSEEKTEFDSMQKDYTDGIQGLAMALQTLRDYYQSDAGAAFVQDGAPSVSYHSASGDAASGIIGILEVAQSDFSKMLADAEVAEEAAVTAYKKLSHQLDIDVTIKTADVKYQHKEKAGLEKSVADLKEDREGEQAELDAVLEYFAKVKPGCTTKPMTYEERKARREAEIDGLKDAMRILESETPGGAFLQKVRKSA